MPAQLAAGMAVIGHVIELHGITRPDELLVAVPRRGGVREHQKSAVHRRHFADEILDVIGTEAELGKPAGQDLAEGIYTLPVLLAMADPEAGPELSPLLGQPLGQPERDKARAIVAASGAIARSVSVAREYAEQAAAAAGSAASPELSTAFARLAHSLVDGLPGA